MFQILCLSASRTEPYLIPKEPFVMNANKVPQGPTAEFSSFLQHAQFLVLVMSPLPQNFVHMNIPSLSSFTYLTLHNSSDINLVVTFSEKPSLTSLNKSNKPSAPSVIF